MYIFKYGPLIYYSDERPVNLDFEPDSIFETDNLSRLNKNEYYDIDFELKRVTIKLLPEIKEHEVFSLKEVVNNI